MSEYEGFVHTFHTLRRDLLNLGNIFRLHHLLVLKLFKIKGMLTKYEAMAVQDEVRSRLRMSWNKVPLSLNTRFVVRWSFASLGGFEKVLRGFSRSYRPETGIL